MMNINVKGDSADDWFGIPENVFANQMQELINKYYGRELTTAEYIEEVSKLATTPQVLGYLMYCAGGVVMMGIAKRIPTKEDFHNYVKSKLPQN